MIEAESKMIVGCMGLAFKANIDDFRESPAMKIAAELAAHFKGRISVVEPYAATLPKEFHCTGAGLIDIDTALLECDLLITLVDHDAFTAAPLAERAGKLAYDVRGIWLDQPENTPLRPLRLAS